jgi:hypothetical protein
MAYGFQNLSRGCDTLGDYVTFWGFGDIMKRTTNIGVGQTEGRRCN